MRDTLHRMWLGLPPTTSGVHWMIAGCVLYLALVIGWLLIGPSLESWLHDHCENGVWEIDADLGYVTFLLCGPLLACDIGALISLLFFVQGV